MGEDRRGLPAPTSLLPPVVVVTGSRGFIGSHLVEALVAQGTRVRCLVREGSAPDLATISGGAIEQHVVDYDDTRRLERAPALDGVDYIFHLAGVTKGVGEREFRAGNVVPTAGLVDAIAARSTSQLKRFVLVSSQAAAGPARALEEPCDEEQPAEPVEEYGRSKLEAEHIVAARGDAIPFTIVRPSAVYGPRDRDFLNVFKQARHGVGLYPANRERYLSVIHVRDVVRGLLAAARADSAVGRTYYLTADPAVSWRDVYRAAGAAVGRPMTEINLPQTLVDAAGLLGDVHAWLTGTPSLVTRQKIALSKAEYWVCSGARAARDFGFHAGIGLTEGMRETYRWYVEHRWVD